ncbi:MAG: hypothetical protein KDD62_12780 [Bdellovibrionales bacterium]|nr:hypothetical protein [Bdellovibrionales bacterium]
MSSRQARFQPDSLISYLAKFDEYGLIIHDGGSAVRSIQFCPFCGTKLPASRREQWFLELEKLGITEPDDDRMPEEFKSDKWYRS